jgi:hypothetical protein
LAGGSAKEIHMNVRGHALIRATLCFWIWLLLVSATGCNSPYTYAATAIGATIVGAQSPSHEIEQVYYLGIVDPHEQIPTAIYRLTVRGQASFISNTKFASGWVPAQLVDSLNSHIGFEEKGPGVATTQPANSDQLSRIQTGRRLVLFGPEGFREAPRDHRLVIVMGANPDAFFQAIDQALGTLATVQQDSSNARVKALMVEAIAEVNAERARLDALQKDVDAQVAITPASSATPGSGGSQPTAVTPTPASAPSNNH